MRSEKHYHEFSHPIGKTPVNTSIIIRVKELYNYQNWVQEFYYSITQKGQEGEPKSSINYSALKGVIEGYFGFQWHPQDIDLALQIEKPFVDDKSSTEDKGLLKKWEKSDRPSIMLMRMHIDANIKGSLPKPESAKDFMDIIKERFKTADKSLAGKLMSQLTTMKYNGAQSMHHHVIEMRSIAAKLTEMKLNVDENFLVQFILNSLPDQYAAFQVHYNTIKEKCTANELANMLVQEEARLKQLISV
ncbi:uncharacterized protein LOC113318529 [Papaver somniferum]|uniref:uncharacterized protein LOC113318529 n=1 Tax=Papaver somniferum TaxID=3469 RepID=UPI000E6FB675|nr:uncharacterized protein LOC113318529 [Papaver somniferum]